MRRTRSDQRSASRASPLDRRPDAHFPVGESRGLLEEGADAECVERKGVRLVSLGQRGAAGSARFGNVRARSRSAATENPADCFSESLRLCASHFVEAQQPPRRRHSRDRPSARRSPQSRVASVVGHRSSIESLSLYLVVESSRVYFSVDSRESRSGPPSVAHSQVPPRGALIAGAASRFLIGD